MNSDFKDLISPFNQFDARMSKKVREVKVTWYDDLDEAARDLDAEYAKMTPDERVAECVRLMIQFGGWQEHGRLERVARVIEPPRS